MDPYIEQLKNHISKSQCRYGDRDIHSLLEMLCRFYTEYNPIDSEAIQVSFHNLENYFLHLTPQENDQVFDIICTLCVEHERAAFLEGIRVGAQLVIEMSKL